MPRDVPSTPPFPKKDCRSTAGATSSRCTGSATSPAAQRVLRRGLAGLARDCSVSLVGFSRAWVDAARHWLAHGLNSGRAAGGPRSTFTRRDRKGDAQRSVPDVREVGQSQARATELRTTVVLAVLDERLSVCCYIILDTSTKVLISHWRTRYHRYYSSY
jgi:hypothetical protein